MAWECTYLKHSLFVQSLSYSTSSFLFPQLLHVQLSASDVIDLLNMCQVNNSPQTISHIPAVITAKKR